MHVNYITLIQSLLPEIMRITTDTLDIIISYTCHTGHWYTVISDTVISYTCITVTRSLLLHVLVASLHEHSCTLDTVISYKHWLHWILLFHIFVSLITLIRYTCTSGTCITFTRVLCTVIICTCRMNSPVFMLWLFLYSCCNGLLFLLHGYSCIPVTWLYPVILIWYSCY